MSLSSSRSRAIFEQAIEIVSPAEREAFVRESCGQDFELLHTIRRLLDADSEAGGFLPADPGQEPPTSVCDFDVQGTTIGRYRLLERIGEGGMGVVYRAQQEEPVRRQVALKIIKLGMDTRQVIARFEAERQALALMNHPNIAKIFDAGVTGDPDSELTPRPFPLTTPSGRPYFVMELVDGIPITEFCGKNQLTIEQRLQLFIQVCGAVQHAHQKGIIHRDLKPSNVLVATIAGVPVPKVIDFGVAKAINQKLTDKTLLTQHLVMIGTPAYMSPEQADLAGLDVDTRSDIYSLGVLLYELLAGTPPFPEERLRRVSQSEMQRIIAQEEPERPSTRLTKLHSDSPSSLAPRLSPLATDLDWIVMKCLEKDRNRRYETASGLAADLQRFLADEPVVARPPSAAYRIQKAIHRNRLAFTAAVSVLLVLCIGIGVSAWQARRADLERQRAERQLEATLQFIDVVFEKVSPRMQVIIGATEANQILLASGQRLMEKLRPAEEPRGEFRRVLGQLNSGLAKAYGWTVGNTAGDFPSGLRYASEALRLLTPAPGESPDDLRLDQLTNMEMHSGFSCWGLQDYPEAQVHFRRMAQWADRLGGSSDPAWAKEGKKYKGWAEWCVGDILIAMGPEQAKVALTEIFPPRSVGIMERFATGSVTNLDDLKDVPAESLADAYIRMGQYTNALPSCRVFLQVAGMISAQRPNLAQEASQVVNAGGKLGHVLMVLDQPAEGRQVLEQALERAEALVQRDPNNVGFAQLRIKTLSLFARGLAHWSADASAPLGERQGRLATAQEHLDRAESLRKKLTPESAVLWLRPDMEPAVAEVAAARAKLDSKAASPP